VFCRGLTKISCGSTQFLKIGLLGINKQRIPMQKKTLGLAEKIISVEKPEPENIFG
jgi:hypothetical protein